MVKASMCDFGELDTSNKRRKGTTRQEDPEQVLQVVQIGNIISVFHFQ